LLQQLGEPQSERQTGDLLDELAACCLTLATADIGPSRKAPGWQYLRRVTSRASSQRRTPGLKVASLGSRDEAQRLVPSHWEVVE
jgi:hypothetical protein